MTDLKCTQTDNALIWAEDFMRTMRENKWTLEDIDEGLMISWFANAIECSHDVREARNNTLTATDALFGFSGWLTSREEVISMGSSEDCAPVIEVISAFLDANNLPYPSDNYPDNFVCPDNCKNTKNS